MELSPQCLRRTNSDYEDAVKHSEKNNCVVDLIGGDLLKWTVTFSGPVCPLFVLLIRKLARFTDAIIISPTVYLRASRLH